MSRFEVHPEVRKDLQALPPPNAATLHADTHMDEFLDEIEALANRADYRQVWPDRIPNIGEASYGGNEYQIVIGAVTIYGWELEGYVVCLEERTAYALAPRFRWVLCKHGLSADAAMKEAA